MLKLKEIVISLDKVFLENKLGAELKNDVKLVLIGTRGILRGLGNITAAII